MAIADYPYSFASQPIIDPTTGQPVLNATNGVLQDPASGALLSMADMNGNPITQITGNAYGMSQQFRSTQLAVLVKFGNVFVQAPSIEMFNLVQTTADAVALAQSAQSLAAAAAAAAQAAAAQVASGGGGGGVTVHGQLSGLGADDHPQYHNDTRGDARYYGKTTVDAMVASAAGANSVADRDRANHTGVQVMSTITGLQAALDAKRDSFDASMAGTLAVTVGALGKRLPAACVLDSVTAKVGTAPAGASVVVDVKRNGTTIFATTANRPTITAGSTGITTPATSASVTSFAAGDYLTVDVAQVGSTTAGADLVVSVWLRF